MCMIYTFTVFMSTLYSDAFKHKATVLCDSVLDVDKDIVCSTFGFKKGRMGKRWDLSARIIYHFL